MNRYALEETVISPNQLLTQLNWRYATKQFDPAAKIPAADWEALEEAVLLTPSGYGLQPWEVLVVTDEVVREKLLPVSYSQRQVVDASHLVVFAIKTNFSARDVDAYVNRMAEVRGIPVESLAGLRTMMVGAVVEGMDSATRDGWAAKQAYIALGNFLTSAALLGIDACPMEGFDPAGYNQVLGLEEKGLSAVVIAAAGYRAATDKYASTTKVRLPRSQVVHRIENNAQPVAA